MDDCKQCGSPVFTRDWDGFPDAHCERCTQAFIDRSNESLEWGYFHPGETIPASELTPLPQKSVIAPGETVRQDAASSVCQANEKDSQ